MTDGTDKSISEIIRLYAALGIDGFFTPWEKGKISEWARTANDTGMFYQSVHAPFGEIAELWHGERNKAEAVLSELTECLEECSENSVPIMVSHVYIGDFNTVGVPSGEGLERFSRLIRRADTLGVSIALENTEGEEYLDALFRNFGGERSVGFCIDSGHEQCYNRGKDLLALYGDKLIATHINDNLGVCDPAGLITWRDDLHLMPYDGIIDWSAFAGRLKKCGYSGPLTFEMKRKSVGGRHENDAYAAMPYEEYIAECFSRAKKFAEEQKIAVHH